MAVLKTKMKWFDENAYNAENGEGIVALTDEERRRLRPGDEVLLGCANGWEPTTVTSNERGSIQAYRTKRLPKGFLIPNCDLKAYSKQLLAQEKDNGHRESAPPGYARRLLLIRMVELLKYEFPGRDVPMRPLKHRCVNEVLDKLAMSHLELHHVTERSTDHGWWVKYIEWNVRDLKELIGPLESFRQFGEELVGVVPYKTIRWVGSEKAYRRLLASRLFEDEETGGE